MSQEEKELTSILQTLELSEEESVLLLKIVQLKSNKQIAEETALNVGTVKSRLFRLYQNMGVKTRVGAALKGAQALWAKGVEF